MNNTQELQLKYGPKHVLHPFRFFCELCKTETVCKDCTSYYYHDYCEECHDRAYVD